MPPPARKEFRLTLEVRIEDDGSDVPVVVRLRRLLKRLLRQFGFRLKDISECEPTCVRDQHFPDSSKRRS
jgi:hypothetical protein